MKVERSPAQWCRRYPLASAGLVVIVFLTVCAAIAPVIARHDPEAVDPIHMLQAPSWSHPLGTDDVGRDLLSRLIYAGRVSLVIGLGVALLSVSLGGILGALAGYYGGWIDSVISRVVDAMLAFPILALAMVVGSFLNLDPVRFVLLLSALSWVTAARLVRADFLSLKEREFTSAAQAIGASDLRVIFRHLLPNAFSPLIVNATLLVAFAILTESALSFLGFGIQPPTPSWGNLLSGSQLYVRNAPWLSIFPGVMIALTVLAFNFVGDGIREAFDPRTQKIMQ